MAALPMIFTYPFFYTAERLIVRSRSFEKTWQRLRPKLEKGIDLIAQEAHPQGRSLLRKYVYQEPTVKRIVNDCLRDMTTTDVMVLFKQVQFIKRDVAKRNKKVLEWEKDLISAPKTSRNPLTYSHSQLKEKIEKAKDRNIDAEKRAETLIDTSLEKLEARGINLSKAQIDFLLSTAEGEDIVSIMACADMIKQIYHRMSSQLEDGNVNPELSKSFAGFHMMCCRLYLEAIDRALIKIEKTYLPRIGVIQNKSTKYIIKAEQKIEHPKIENSQKERLKNNISINHQIIEVAKFYLKHLNKRAKDLLELKEKAQLNYEISLNTFLTMKIGADLTEVLKASETDLASIFEFETPSLPVFDNNDFGDQFISVTKQLRQE